MPEKYSYLRRWGNSAAENGGKVVDLDKEGAFNLYINRLATLHTFFNPFLKTSTKQSTSISFKTYRNAAFFGYGRIGTLIGIERTFAVLS